MTFQESIQDYALNWSAFCVAVKKQAGMIKAVKKEGHTSILQAMTEEERREIFSLGSVIANHAYKCNDIAKRIGFTSLTAEYNSMMDIEDALFLVLSKEGV